MGDKEWGGGRIENASWPLGSAAAGSGVHSGLGVSLAEYVRRLVARDLGEHRPPVGPSTVFDLGGSGGSDVAASKDEMIGRAVEDRRQPRSDGR